MYDVITVGGAIYDITIYPIEGILIDNKNDILRQKLLAFEYGAKIKSERIVRGFGGGAANTAVSFSRLGFKTAIITATGKDIFGKEIIGNLIKQKVDAEPAQKKNGFKSGLAVIIVGPDKDRVIFSDDEVKKELKLTTKDEKALKNTGWIYINSLSGGWKENLKKIFKVKKKNPDIKIAWNPGEAQLSAGFLGLKNFINHTKVFMVNLDEAIQLVVSDPKFKNKNTKFFNNARNLLPIIKSYGPQIIVITCGKNGAWAYDGKEFYFTKIKKEQKRVDTTGVGDAFNSSFVAGLELFNGNIKKAMKLGAANAASLVAMPGAQNGLLSKRDLAKLNL